MPYILVVIGLMLVITGARNTYGEFFRLLKGDFTGDFKKSFVAWVIAIFAVGALGYIPTLQKFSRWFLVLIIVAIVLANGGFFQKFMEAVQAGPITPPQNPANAGASNGGSITQSSSSWLDQFLYGQSGSFSGMITQPGTAGGFISGLGSTVGKYLPFLLVP